MHLLEIQSEAEWQQLLDKFSAETGMPGAVYDIENNLILTTGERNTVCLDIRKNDNARATICSLSQNTLAQMARKSKLPVTDYCDAGFIKTVIPFFYGNEYLGGLTVCGDADPDSQIELPYIAEALNISLEELEKREVKENIFDKIEKTAVKYHQILTVLRI
ncbi:PocR ligand-binding domain-containing protein [candidate division CSSED10-310 bacterium]|uniref:PocR ligand-binding domain-containing protein n=1 Tax=candidate division CSSED10-310 bacterium TaxID=2855610 RepID=A0ABV6Z5A3_UNCC1